MNLISGTQERKQQDRSKIKYISSDFSDEGSQVEVRYGLDVG